MSEKGSVFQKGGGGTYFEQNVQAAFLTTLIIKGNAPLNYSNEIIEVAFQTTNKGWNTDDLLVVSKSSAGLHNLLFQIKHDISFTKGSTLFKEVLHAFWADFNSNLFNRENDRLIIVKNGLTRDERNHLKSILSWAKTHASEIDFITEVNRIIGKTEQLDVFRELLKIENKYTPISDKELWEFLKCIDVLEYDFTNYHGVDETYFLNLIKLSKSYDTTLSEKEIWDSILSYVSKLNKEGGSVDTNSIKKEELYKSFSLSKLEPYLKSVEKLKSNSTVILKSFKNTIDKLHLERNLNNQVIAESVTNEKFTIVTGKPGIGKSAAIKDIIATGFNNASVFVFKADLFNESTIAKTFSSIGVNESIQDIFSCISLFPEKIVFIDSLEKLLEADPECAFKELIEILKEFPDIKVIASSRKYAIELIIQKFGIDKNYITIKEVLPLDDVELGFISEKFPNLIEVIKNKKIKELLRSPKYLDFSISALRKSDDNYSNLSLSEFKHSLWNTLVVDVLNTKNGVHFKREKAFMEIAVNRAKEMKLFFKPINSDPEALALLEKDEIIFQDNKERRFSPAHDILEDWALEKYISDEYEKFSRPKELFNNLGTEPAIRRAFRLWVEDYLLDESEKIIDLVRSTVTDSTIESYWADELFIAIFKSENSYNFFKSFETELLESNAKLFNRCLHLIRTSCKESYSIDKNIILLVPVGSGWQEALVFILKNIESLDALYLSIGGLIIDWQFRLILQYEEIEVEELNNTKSIIVYYLDKVGLGSDEWQEASILNIAKEFVSILFNMPKIAKKEIAILIDHAFKNKGNHRRWRADSFYESVIEKCLSGFLNQRFIVELPEIIISTAWREWKTVPIPPPPVDVINRRKSWINYEELQNKDCWGIVDDHLFFPAGIFKTPFYTLLSYHPVMGIFFIIDFINYTVDYYLNSDCKNKIKLEQIEIELNDGTKKFMWGSLDLWVAYRGIIVPHNLIVSLLMSLEKFLLELASVCTDNSRILINRFFESILSHSNNVSLISVLNSVTLAYPNEVGNAFLPILSARKFYEWDLQRSTNESSVLALVDHDNQYAQEENKRSNSLPHRKKYLKGLNSFIIEYQFLIRTYNNEIHQLFDKLIDSNSKDDIFWDKTLTEIDARTYKYGPFNEQLGGYTIEPTYNEQVTELIESNREMFELDGKSINYSQRLSNAYNLTEEIKFPFWNECYIHYLNPINLNLPFDRQITLAVLGLRNFQIEITETQKTWCIKTITNSLENILLETIEREFRNVTNYNLMEKEIALSSFHLLLNSISDRKTRGSIIVLMLKIVCFEDSNYELNKLVNYLNFTFFKHYPKEGKNIWRGIIQFAKHLKSNPDFFQELEIENDYNGGSKSERFFEKLIEDDEKELNISAINFMDYEAYILIKALRISQFNIEDNDYSKFVKVFVFCLSEDLKYNENESIGRRVRRQITGNQVVPIKYYLQGFLINSRKELSIAIIDLFVDSINFDSNINLYHRDEIVELFSRLLEGMIVELDQTIARSSDTINNKRLITNFWVIWEHIYIRVKNYNKLLFGSILLLGIQWSDGFKHWIPLEGKKEFYHKMVIDLGPLNVEAIIKFFSTVGEKTFLPEGVEWIVKIFRDYPDTIKSLITKSGERFVKILFYNHITKIKSDKMLINDYIWILDKMVDLGSSEAYLFRENVITYKKN